MTYIPPNVQGKRSYGYVKRNWACTGYSDYKYPTDVENHMPNQNPLFTVRRRLCIHNQRSKRTDFLQLGRFGVRRVPEARSSFTSLAPNSFEPSKPSCACFYCTLFKKMFAPVARESNFTTILPQWPSVHHRPEPVEEPMEVEQEEEEEEEMDQE